MANKCYKLVNLGCDNVTRTFYVCAETLVTGSGGNCNGVTFFVNGVLTGSAKSTVITLVACSACAGCQCAPQLENEPCDCVNGGCVPKTTYNTPGVFPNLAACQSGCAKNSNCTGECIDPSEIAAHQQALNNLQAKIC
jgi:hypothetical protein